MEVLLSRYFNFNFVNFVSVPIVIRKMTVEVEGHQNHVRGHGALGTLSFVILSNISIANSLSFYHLPGPLLFKGWITLSTG